MRRAPLAVAVAAGLFLSSACSGGTSSTNSGHEQLLEAIEPPSHREVDKLLTDIEGKHSKLEAGIYAGALKLRVYLGACAVILDQKTRAAKVVINPGLLNSYDTKAGNYTSQVYGYSSVENQVYYGGPSVVHTDNGKANGIYSISSDSKYGLIMDENSHETMAKVAVGADKVLRDANGNHIAQVALSSSLRPHQSLGDFARSLEVQQSCSEGLLQSQQSFQQKLFNI